MLLCEYVLNSTRAPPSEALLFHTLLQLYLADDVPEEHDDQSMAATSETTRRCAAKWVWTLPCLRNQHAQLPFLSVYAAFHAVRSVSVLCIAYWALKHMQLHTDAQSDTPYSPNVILYVHG